MTDSTTPPPVSEEQLDALIAITESCNDYLECRAFTELKTSRTIIAALRKEVEVLKGDLSAFVGAWGVADTERSLSRAEVTRLAAIVDELRRDAGRWRFISTRINWRDERIGMASGYQRRWTHVDVRNWPYPPSESIGEYIDAQLQPLGAP